MVAAFAHASSMVQGCTQATATRGKPRRHASQRASASGGLSPTRRQPPTHHTIAGTCSTSDRRPSGSPPILLLLLLLLFDDAAGRMSRVPSPQPTSLFRPPRSAASLHGARSPVKLRGSGLCRRSCARRGGGNGFAAKHTRAATHGGQCLSRKGSPRLVARAQSGTRA
jgi:hypothetical protein